MLLQQVWNSPFVFCHLFYTHTLILSHGCLLPDALIQSLARMLLVLCHSLAVANLFTTFFSPSLPPSFTNSLVCLLSPSFLPFNSSLDFNFPHSLTHSLTHTIALLLLHFLTYYVARLLSLLSLLTRLLAFRFTLSLTYSLNNLLTRSTVSSFTPSLTSSLYTV